MKYRKKPVTIEAVRVTSADFNGTDWDGSPFSEIPEWLNGAIADGVVRPHSQDTDYCGWVIETREGIMLAQTGDYIIYGVKGELYPCKPDIFEMTYEAA